MLFRKESQPFGFSSQELNFIDCLIYGAKPLIALYTVTTLTLSWSRKPLFK